MKKTIMLIKILFCSLLLTLFLPVLATSAETADKSTQSAVDKAASEEKEPASVEERRLIAAIQEERVSIREERQELDLKKKELKTLEEGVDKKLAEIDSKLQELKRQQQSLNELLADKNEKEQKKAEELARIFEKMSPDKAALALTGLDQQLAAALLGKMKVKAAAKILDQISKQKASELSTTYSTIQLE